MTTVIQDPQQRHHQGQSRWDRFERADLFQQYREWPTQGVSERQAAQELQVHRPTRTRRDVPGGAITVSHACDQDTLVPLRRC